MMKRAAVLVLAAVLGAAAPGCSPVIENHGYAPDEALLTDIAVGQDTRGSVQRKIGRPSSTGVFSDTGWYYVSTTIKRHMYHAPKVIDRRVVAIEFDQNDIVTAMNEYPTEIPEHTLQQWKQLQNLAQVT
jgi:outer membrane protein assembly factor BamE (lipoprotein component of BamABCDE complex)